MSAQGINRGLIRRQRGAALAVALILLIIITLLGLAAIRSSQTGLRMARNAEARAAAQQAAEAMVSQVLEAGTTYLPVNDNAGYKACNKVALDDSLSLVAEGKYKDTCTSGTVETIPPALEDLLEGNGYLVVTREPPLFAESGVLREVENSGRGYDFARYKIVGGFDRSESAEGAAEINELRLVPHVKDSLLGVNYQ